jgi:hypothetical protein
MADRNDQNTTGRTVAIVGGGALLLLLLLRGKGWGLGDARDDQRSGEGTAPDGSVAPTRCEVRIDADGIALDGTPADLAIVIERCRAAGEADVRATGAAITGIVAHVIQALQDAGVRVWASAELRETAGVTPVGRSS